MEKKRPEVIIESAEPLSSDSSPSESTEEEVKIPRRPTRLNALSTVSAIGSIPRGMRPANSTMNYQEESEEGEVPDYEQKRRNLSLTHPLVLVAASIGIGILIGVYGTELLRPAVDKVVEAAEEIIDENN